MREDTDENLALSPHPPSDRSPSTLYLSGTNSGRGCSLQTKLTETHPVALSGHMGVVFDAEGFAKLCFLRL